MNFETIERALNVTQEGKRNSSSWKQTTKNPNELEEALQGKRLPNGRSIGCCFCRQGRKSSQTGATVGLYIDQFARSSDRSNPQFNAKPPKTTDSGILKKRRYCRADSGVVIR